jgi:VWFA-related protein
MAGRVGLVFLVCASAGALLVGQQRPTFRADVNFITVDAYPLVKGRVVEGLSKADFEVREDGRVQTIESFEFVRAADRLTEAERREPNNQREMLDQLVDPRSRVFVAFLDVHHLAMPDDPNGVAGAFYSRLPLLELFDRILAPADLIALMTSRNNPRDLTFGRKSTVIAQQLSDFWTWRDPDVTLNDAEELALKTCFPKVAGLGDILIERRRQDQLLSTLEGLIEYLGEVREGRKTLFLFSTGWTWHVQDTNLLKVLNKPDYVPPIAPPITNEPWRNLRSVNSLFEGSRAACEQELMRLANLNNPPRFRDLLRDAALANVSVYPVNPAGVGAIGPRNDRLMEFAANTGGTAVSNRNDLVQGVIDVSRELEGYYLLGYASDNRKTDGTLRRIEVKVNRPGVEVKARRGYRAMTAADAAAREAAARGASPVSDERATFEEALAGLARVRGTEEVFVRGHHTPAGLELVVEVAPGRIGKAWTVDLQVTPADGQGEPRAVRGQIPATGRSAVIPVPGEGMTAHPWRVTARLRTAEADVIEGAGQVPVRVEPRVSRSGSAAVSPVRAAADLRFMRSERLILDWRTEAAPGMLQARVLDRAGAPLAVAVQVTAGPEPGTLRGIVSLAALAPGDYVVELLGTAGGGQARQLTAFRVVR